MSCCHTLHFIALQESRDQASRQRPGIDKVRRAAISSSFQVCLNQRWQGRGFSDGRRCDSHCDSRTGWSPYLQPKPQQPPEDGGDGQNVHYMLSRMCLVDKRPTTLGYP